MVEVSKEGRDQNEPAQKKSSLLQKVAEGKKGNARAAAGKAANVNENYVEKDSDKEITGTAKGCRWNRRRASGAANGIGIGIPMVNLKIFTKWHPADDHGFQLGRPIQCQSSANPVPTSAKKTGLFGCFRVVMRINGNCPQTLCA